MSQKQVLRESRETLELMHQTLVNAGISPGAIYSRVAKEGFFLLGRKRFRHRVHAVLWNVLEEVTGDPEIGLHLCPHMPIFRGRVFEYLFLSSRNFEDGLRTAFQYQRLVSDAFRVRLVVDDNGPRILMRGAIGDAPQLRHSETCTAYAFLQAMDRVTDGVFKPERICLRAIAVAPAREYEALFGCPVSFTDTETQLWLAPALLRRRSLHGDPGLQALHRAYADNALQKVDRNDLVQNITDFMRHQAITGQHTDTSHLDGGGGNLPAIAARFDVSERHLRFVLSQAGTNFRTLAQDARMMGATHMMQSTDMTFEEIASLLGYSEPSAFHRAFKAWAGVTASRYRKGKRAKETSSR